MKCKGCGLAAHPAITCRMADARSRMVVDSQSSAPDGGRQAVDSGESLAHLVVDILPSRHGKHADLEKRRARQRAWVAAKRAAK